MRYGYSYDVAIIKMDLYFKTIAQYVSKLYFNETLYYFLWTLLFHYAHSFAS